MKIATTLCIALFLFSFIPNQDIKTIELGTNCPMADVKFKNIDKTEFSLTDAKKENGLLVIFSCNTCPFVIGGDNSEGWEGRYNGIQKLAIENNTGMVLVNSNHAKRDKGDSFEDMIKRAEEKKYTMSYVYDDESKLANAFGARTTPHVFLFDKQLKLVYRGSIDDNVTAAKDVKAKYLEQAILANAKGKKIKKNDTKAVGCSIKRVAK